MSCSAREGLRNNYVKSKIKAKKVWNKVLEILGLLLYSIVSEVLGQKGQSKHCIPRSDIAEPGI